MSELEPAAADFEQTYQRIAGILAEARGRAYQAINAAMVMAYWEIGRAIVEVEQQGQGRADYGKELVERLARRLRAEFGKGFDRSNLWHMRAFYLAYPKLDAVRRELSWTDENPPIGIILCTDKNAAVVRYTLPEGNTQIFASRYKLYLPTEEELAAELQRERQTIELRQHLAEGGEGPGASPL